MKESKQPLAQALTSKKGMRLLGMDIQSWIKFFFGGNAFLAVVILVLICVFLLREGAGFFPRHYHNLQVYRLAGLEFVDYASVKVEEHTALARLLTSIRLEELTQLEERAEMTREEAVAAQAPLMKFTNDFRRTISPFRTIQTEAGRIASDLKTRADVAESRKEQRELFLRTGMEKEAQELQIEEIDFPAEVKALTDLTPRFAAAAEEVRLEIEAVMGNFPAPVGNYTEPKYDRARELIEQFQDELPLVSRQMQNWDHSETVPVTKAFTAFIFGRDWITNSYWHEFYGMLPLFLGSLMISLVAISISVPFGVGAAIFVNQMATKYERDFIKPFIEFIEAIPSVVLGFFGIIVLGETIRQLSGWAVFAWIPFFPLSDRLNIFAAGLLLALMAVPTIFTLAEDAINNVPRYLTEASLAVGATKLQTVARIVVPAALSGIIAAVLLGFGRVIGETMVVLLVAGNRISLPDLSLGLGIFFQPTHTMTAIIAQEMGEVVRGGLHYRALFMVGLVLFTISLIVNFLAQKVVTKFKIEA